MISSLEIAKNQELHLHINQIAEAFLARDIGLARKALAAIFILNPTHEDIPFWRESLQILQAYDWVGALDLDTIISIKDGKTVTHYKVRELLSAELKGNPMIPLEKIKTSIASGHTAIPSQNSTIPLNTPTVYH
jgi:hypothetical protein